MPKKYTGPNRRIKERRLGRESITQDAGKSYWNIGTLEKIQRRDSTKNRRKNK